MNNEKQKCKKCGLELKKSGPYADNKPEGEPTQKRLLEVNFYCLNKSCDNFYKNIKVIE